MLTIHYIDACLLFVILCSIFNLPLLWWFLSYIVNFGFFTCGLILILFSIHKLCDFLGISIEVPNLGGSDIARRRARRDARMEARRYWEGLLATPRGRQRRIVQGETRTGAGAGRESRHSSHRVSVRREEDS